MPYGTGPFGVDTLGIAAAEPEAEATGTIVTSRKIDFATGRYVLDDNGNAESMPDLHQRVGLLLAYGVKEPDLIGDDFAGEMEKQIRAALSVLVAEGLIIKRVEVSLAPGNSYRLVEFFDGSVVKV